MRRVGLQAATALSLALALLAPAAAQDLYQNSHPIRPPRHATVYGEPSLPIENALRWGYSQGYSNYPSGFGGLYGDGRYPGNTISNARPSNTLR